MGLENLFGGLGGIGDIFAPIIALFEGLLGILTDLFGGIVG